MSAFPKYTQIQKVLFAFNQCEGNICSLMMFVLDYMVFEPGDA